MTKAEKEQLEAYRSRPKLEYTLKPDGATNDAVRRALEAAREKRIQYIQERLDHAQENIQAKEQFNDRSK